MSKENADPIPNVPKIKVTEEERARISRNFRAAKALLARKRPRLHHHASPSFPHK